MKSIVALTNADGVRAPETPFPASATLIVCDGAGYRVAETEAEAAALRAELGL